MSRPDTDRHLLLGILAFQNNFISREQLLAAFNAWVLDKQRALGDILLALKQIQAHHADDPHSRARFLLEAEITGGLEHPGIVPVYGLGTYNNGRPFYAMRFIRGDSLQEAVDRFHGSARVSDPAETADPRFPAVRPPQSAFDSLSFRQLLRRFLDVCNAMQYAHDRGVLHRDLKPGNVMLGKYGETLVVDWGLAKAIGRGNGERTDAGGEATLKPASASGSAPTQMGAAIGTPAYMSPEQAAGRLDQLGPASDVYSLGATLYSLLTGKPPFDKETSALCCAKSSRADSRDLASASGKCRAPWKRSA